MLDIFHKLPGAAKKFLETQGRPGPDPGPCYHPLVCSLLKLTLQPGYGLMVHVAACRRRPARHCGAHDRPRRVTAQAAWGSRPLQAMVPVPAAPRPLPESLSSREVGDVWAAESVRALLEA